MAVKVSLNQLGPDVIAFIENNGGGSGSAKLEKDITSNVTVGAAASGTNFPMFQTFTEFAEAILRKDITPAVSASFTGAGTKEKGTTINGTTMTLTITNINDVTVPMTTINFYDGGVLLHSTPFVDKQATYSYTYNQTITTDKTVRAELVYGTGQKVFSDGKFTFVYPSYVGTTQLANITASDAEALAAQFKKEIKTTKAYTWNNIILKDARFCYMYPSSLGALTSIKDGNGFNQMDGYKRTELIITSPSDGKQVKYYVYLLEDAATGVGFTQVYA